MNTVFILLVATLAVLLVGGLASTVALTVRALFAIPTTALTALLSMLSTTQLRVAVGIARTRSALAFRTAAGPPAPAYSLWDALAPLVYAVFAVMIVGGDLVLASLRFGALLGLPVSELPVSGTALDVLAGVLFVAVLGTYGLVLLDVAHVTPTSRPFGLATGRTARTLLVLASGGTLLSVLAGAVFLWWGQTALTGAPNDDLASLFTVLFGLLLVGASVLAIAGALALPLVGWLLVLNLLLALTALAAWLLRVVRATLCAVHDLAQAVVLLVSWPGRIIWNWIAAQSFAGRAQLRPVALPGPLPPLIAV